MLALQNYPPYPTQYSTFSFAKEPTYITGANWVLVLIRQSGMLGRGFEFNRAYNKGWGWAGLVEIFEEVPVYADVNKRSEQ